MQSKNGSATPSRWRAQRSRKVPVRFWVVVFDKLSLDVSNKQGNDGASVDIYSQRARKPYASEILMRNYKSGSTYKVLVLILVIQQNTLQLFSFCSSAGKRKCAWSRLALAATFAAALFGPDPVTWIRMSFGRVSSREHVKSGL